jgi:ADP-ribosylation factor-like protein 2
VHSGYFLNLWDVCGQKSIRAYWRNYFESTDGLIWVIDSVDGVRLQLCKVELHHLLQQERLAGASLLIFANKQDICGAIPPAELAKILELETNSRFRSRHWTIVGCSGKTGAGLVFGMNWLVGDISNRIFMHS